MDKQGLSFRLYYRGIPERLEIRRANFWRVQKPRGFWHMLKNHPILQPELFMPPVLTGGSWQEEKQMAERETLIDNYRVIYEGLFSVKDLYSLIDEYFEEKGYDRREKKNIGG